MQRATVTDQLARWCDKYPEVVVTPFMTHGDPATELIGKSETASMIVVGSRGRPGSQGALLGSTSQALIAGAGCPLVVVRSRQDPGR
jgi:nucleotide-binding universal stress UspA family protein